MNLDKFRKINELKTIYRACSVQDRKESSAEHTWSSLMLADYFLDKYYSNLNKLKIFELLLYHDVVEIEAEDIPIHHDEKRLIKKEEEKKAAEKLKTEIINGNKFQKLFLEFEEQKTIESKFAKAIDKLDASLHELDYPKDWKAWTPEMYKKYNHDELFKDFPELLKINNEILEFTIKNNYFN